MRMHVQAMARPTYNAILQYAKSKPAIVFAPTRRHAKQMATDLMTFTASDGTPGRFLKVCLARVLHWHAPALIFAPCAFRLQSLCPRTRPAVCVRSGALGVSRCAAT